MLLSLTPTRAPFLEDLRLKGFLFPFIQGTDEIITLSLYAKLQLPSYMSCGRRNEASSHNNLYPYYMHDS